MVRICEEHEIGKFKSKALNKIVVVKYTKQNYSRAYRAMGWSIDFSDTKGVYIGHILIKDERLKFHIHQLCGAYRGFESCVCFGCKGHEHEILIDIMPKQVEELIEEFKQAYESKKLKPII